MEYKRYEKYKDSGIEWIGEIPVEWNMMKLKYLTRLGYGDALPTESREEGDISVFGSNGTVGTHNRPNTLKPALIVGRKGSYGKVTYSEEKCFVIDTAYYIDSRLTNSNIRWLFYLLSSMELDKNSQDTGVPGLSREYAYSNMVTVPTEKEQILLADFLDQKSTEIDDLIADKEKLISLLQEQRQAIITEAVTKGLNPDVKTKDSGIEWIGEIPEHWEVKKIKYLLGRQKGSIKAGPFGSQLKTDEMEDNEVKVYNQRNVLDGDLKAGENYISRDKYQELMAFTVFSRDILVTTRGTIGKAKLVYDDCELGILHPCLMRIQVQETLICPELIEIVFNETKLLFEQVFFSSNATTIEVIYSDTLKNIRLPLPSQPEQKEIINYITNVCSEFDSLINNTVNQINNLKDYRQSLISEAVTGKIDVRDYTA